MTLDILRMQRRLRDVGIPQEQAEVFAEEIAHLITGQLVTKADLQELRNEMNGKFAEMNSKFAGIDGKFAGIEGKIAALAGQLAEVRNELADVKVAMADFQTGVAKWAVGLIGAVLLGFAGMSVAIVLSLARLAG